MNEERARLLSKFEETKGHSSNIFDNEEWREFDAFLLGVGVKQTLIQQLKYEISILGLSEEDLTAVNLILEKL